MTSYEDDSATSLKHMFNADRFTHIAKAACSINSAFDGARFFQLTTTSLDERSIMQRLRQTAVSLETCLPGHFTQQLETLYALAPKINHGFVSMILPEFVALYGQDHFTESMDALKYFTQFGSSEFAVRHFLLKDMGRTLTTMQQWAEDENDHVRRLASEGCRPRLPWSFQIKALMEDPTPVAPILQALKSDPALYVRKSVANHLNDITKDHPEWVISLFSTWPEDSPHSQWIIRHALRSLIKQGDQKALNLIGVAGKPDIDIIRFDVSPNLIALGDVITLQVGIQSRSDNTQKLVIDYAIHYVKQNGKISRKVFKFRTTELAALERLDLSSRQTIKDFTTRKHYTGKHIVELIINGEMVAQQAFSLITN